MRGRLHTFNSSLCSKARHHSSIGDIDDSFPCRWEAVRADIRSRPLTGSVAQDADEAGHTMHLEQLGRNLLSDRQDPDRRGGVHGPRRTVLVIGASRGIGLEVVRAYAAQTSMSVHATVRNLVNPGAVGAIPGVTLHQLDVRNATQRLSLAREFDATHSAIDVLIHNAGINQGSIAEQTEVNADAPFQVVNALLSAVLRSEQKHVCIVTSGSGTRTRIAALERRLRRTREVCGEQWWCAYARSKQRANDLFREVWPSWKKMGVLATAIEPGSVATDMNHGKGDISAIESARGIQRVCSTLSAEQHAGKLYEARGKQLKW